MLKMFAGKRADNQPARANQRGHGFAESHAAYDGAQPHGKTPNFKLQIPEKFQISNPKFQIVSKPQSLKFGAWSFFEVWSLEFGVFISVHPLSRQSSIAPGFCRRRR